MSGVGIHGEIAPSPLSVELCGGRETTKWEGVQRLSTGGSIRCSRTGKCTAGPLWKEEVVTATRDGRTRHADPN